MNTLNQNFCDQKHVNDDLKKQKLFAFRFSLVVSLSNLKSFRAKLAIAADRSAFWPRFPDPSCGRSGAGRKTPRGRSTKSDRETDFSAAAIAAIDGAKQAASFLFL
jgi:hypothetical protein